MKSKIDALFLQIELTIQMQTDPDFSYIFVTIMASVFKTVRLKNLSKL